MKIHQANTDHSIATGQSSLANNIGSQRRLLSPWLVSTVLHVGVLIALALIVQSERVPLKKLVLSLADAAERAKLETVELSTSIDPAEPSDAGEHEHLPVDQALMAEVLASSHLTRSQTELDGSTLVMSTVSELDSELLKPFFAASLGPRLQLIESRRQERPMFEGRTGPLRDELLKTYGGTAETQDAVARGLAWLARNQLPDGTWSMLRPYSRSGVSENSAAATSMALLAFLGDGHTHQSGKYMPQVRSALDVLIAAQRTDGFFGSPVQGKVRILSEVQRMYGQAIASLAVCEAYGMTGDSRLRPHAKLAIQFATRSQAANGGWRYRPGMLGDTSVTGWFLVLFQSAQSAGIDCDTAVLRKIDRFLDSVSVYRGSKYSYVHGERPKPTMTAVGLLCRQYRGWEYDHQTLRHGINSLATEMPFRIADQNVYYWYYATQVFHHDGGRPWEAWNEVMRVQLPAAQTRGGREDGSWEPMLGDFAGRVGGRIYATCLSIYCLEVYYRHMPIYKLVDPDKEIEFPL